MLLSGVFMNLVQKLREEIKEISKKIEAIQSECNHPKSALDSKSKGSTGGYDADTYWTENTCGLCGKFWTVDKD